MIIMIIIMIVSSIITISIIMCGVIVSRTMFTIISIIV